VIIRERNGKKIQETLHPSEIFQNIYTPTPLLDLSFMKKETGKYQVGPFEVAPRNMAILRDEVGRIAVILAQTCITR
jgi:hypothetical protein